MTREKAKQNLIAIGITEPTDEQVSNYLNQLNAESKVHKENAEKYKKDAEESAKSLSDVQAQLDGINKQNMSELELVTKRAEDAEKLLATMRQDKLKSDLTSLFAKNGLSGEVYDIAIGSFSLLGEEEGIKSATAFVEGLSSINKTTLETAKASWEAEKLTQTANIGGTSKPAEPAKEESMGAIIAREHSMRNNPKTEASENAPVNF